MSGISEYEQLCVTNNQDSQKTPIEHHVFDGRWIERPSKPHPTITVSMTPLRTDHEELSHAIGRKSKLSSLTIPMIADSGCQSSVIPLQTAFAMGYGKKDIMPVRLTMRGAISEDLGVEGGVIVQVSIKDVAGLTKSTKQFI